MAYEDTPIEIPFLICTADSDQSRVGLDYRRVDKFLAAFAESMMPLSSKELHGIKIHGLEVGSTVRNLSRTRRRRFRRIGHIWFAAVVRWSRRSTSAAML